MVLCLLLAAGGGSEVWAWTLRSLGKLGTLAQVSKSFFSTMLASLAEDLDKNLSIPGAVTRFYS